MLRPILIMTLVLISSLAVGETKGTGGAVSLSSCAGLLALSSNPAGAYQLTSDIDLSDPSCPSSLVPIPAFSGTLNGNGHTISNLKGATGLFAQNNGTLSNLSLTFQLSSS